MRKILVVLLTKKFYSKDKHYRNIYGPVKMQCPSYGVTERQSVGTHTHSEII